MKVLVAVGLLAAFSLSGCTMDWAAADKKCEEKLGKADAPNEPPHIDLRALGPRLRGTGPATVHCHDLRLGEGADWTLSDVIGNVGAIHVPAGKLTIERSILVVNLDSMPFGIDAPKASVTIIDSLLIMDGFWLNIDHQTALRMVNVTVEPDDFFDHYSIGPFGTSCGRGSHPSLGMERQGSWTFEGVQMRGVGEAEMQFAKPPKDSRIEADKVCVQASGSLDLSGLELHASGLWLQRKGDPDWRPSLKQFVAPRGTYGHLTVESDGWPNLERLVLGNATTTIHGAGWFETDGPLGPASLAPCAYDCPANEGIRFTASKAAACPHGPVAGTGHWAHLAFAAADLYLDGQYGFDIGARAIVGGTPRPYIDGNIAVYGSLDLEVPLLEAMCVEGVLKPVDLYEFQLSNDLFLGCARVDPKAAEIAFRTAPATPKQSHDAVCQAILDLPV